MKKEKFIDELKKFKKDCTNIYWEFKAYKSKLNRIMKTAENLKAEMDSNGSLYKFDEILHMKMGDGWNAKMWNRCDDIVEFMPQSIESISEILGNVKRTGLKNPRNAKKGRKVK